MKTTDFVIVGGGVIGLALAWRLAQRGASPLLIDAGLPSATNAAAGMLAPSFERGASALAEQLYQFSVESLSLWRTFAPELESEARSPIDYRPWGVLGVALRSSDEAALRAEKAELDARGATAEWLDGAEARRLEPVLGDAVTAALCAPEDGQVDARLVANALRAAVTKRGGVITQGVVRSIAQGVVTLVSGERRSAGRIVLAAGAAASSLALPSAPPVFPVKGEALALAAREGGLKRVVRAPGAYLCPKANGRLVIGATEIANETSLEPTPQGVARLRCAAERAAPVLAGFAEIDRWAGLRPATPDAAPILGPDPADSTLVHALGHYRNGVLLAPATADALAEYLLSGKSRLALAAFSLARFNH